jgi:hypothetical protein
MPVPWPEERARRARVRRLGRCNFLRVSDVAQSSSAIRTRQLLFCGCAFALTSSSLTASVASSGAATSWCIFRRRRFSSCRSSLRNDRGRSRSNNSTIFSGLTLSWKRRTQSRVAYSFVEHVLGRRIDHADVDLDLGYFATERLGVRGLASYARTIGGVDWNTKWPDSSPIYLHHDQLLANRHLNIGAGANYAVSDRFDVYTSVLHTLRGRNGHKIHLAANVGIGWTFQPRGIAPAYLRSAVR